MICLNNEKETILLAEKLANIAKKHDCFALYGDLGVGKTAFARGFIQSLSPEHINIASPTFPIVCPYELPNLKLWHFDLYRLKNSAQMLELGLEEALQEGVALIEWPENAENYLPEDALSLYFSIGEADIRILEIKGNAQWMERLKQIF